MVRVRVRVRGTISVRVRLVVDILAEASCLV